MNTLEELISSLTSDFVESVTMYAAGDNGVIVLELKTVDSKIVLYAIDSSRYSPKLVSQTIEDAGVKFYFMCQ